MSSGPAGAGGRRDDRPRSKQGSRKKRTWVPVDEFGDPVALTPDQTARLRERAMNLCVWHLGQGMRTRKQLLETLARKGVPSEMAEEVVSRLEDYNYVNDQAYAETYVRSRHQAQRKGASAIRSELFRKGVDSDTIAEALEQVTPESELANARALVAQKMASTRRLDRQKRVNRLVGMLGRRGYSAGLAFQVVREALDAEADADGDG